MIRVCFGTILGVLCSLSPPTQADTIVLNSGEILFGNVTGESETELAFKIWKKSIRKISKSDIAILDRTFDPARLGKLTPQNLKAYQRYVEELSTVDPASRELGIRMTVIVGWHAKPESRLRIWAVEFLQELARSDKEKLRFSALRKLVNPKIKTGQATEERLEFKQAQEVVKLLDSIRIEDFSSAKKLWRAIKKDFEAETLGSLFGSETAEPEIAQLLNAKELDSRQLLRVLELLQQTKRFGIARRLQKTDWSVESQVAFSGWDEIPTFANVTEFDPKKSLYREGNWVEK